MMNSVILIGLRKGRMVAVEGRLQVRSYENQEGRRVRVAEVVADFVEFLERPAIDKGNDGDSEDIYDKALGFAPGGKPIINEDDLPF